MTRAQKERKEVKAIVEGFATLVIGILIGIAYLCKWFPLDPIEHASLLTIWSYMGWMFAALPILYGLCKIFLDGDL